MNIWMVQPSLEALNELAKNTMIDHLGIEFTEVGEDFLIAKMPVDQRSVTPFRILHGGASAALAESLGSMAANLCVNGSQKVCVGLEINANHVRSVATGFVFGKVQPIHIGSSTQIWEIKICDEQDRLVCISRLTLAVLNKDGKGGR